MELSDQPLNSYEEARQQRITRNKEMLDSLGLTVNTPADPRPPQACASKKAKSSLPQAPPRRSKRLLGEVAASLGDTVSKSASKAGLRAARLDLLPG